MQRFQFPILVLMTCAACCGCRDDNVNSDPSPDSEKSISSEKHEIDASQLSASAKLLDSSEPVRETFAGKWIFVIAQKSNNITSFLIEITERGDASNPEKNQGEYEIVVIEALPEAPPMKLDSYRIEDDAMHLDFRGDGKSFMAFDGKLIEGVVWGNSQFNTGTCLPSFLRPTDHTNLQEPQVADEVAGYADLLGVKTIEDIRELINENSHSPFLPEALVYSVKLAAQTKTSESEFVSFTDEALAETQKWGTRIEFLTRLQVALNMTTFSYLPDVAGQVLEKAEKMIEVDDSLKRYADAIETAKREVEQEKAMVLTRSDDAREQQQGETILLDLKKVQPFDAKIMLALAELAEKRGQLDEAIRQYAELIALPQLEARMMREWRQQRIQKTPPSASFMRLWKQSHKVEQPDVQAVTDYLTKIYESRVFSFVGKRENPPAAVPDGNRTLLIELFTGAHCALCLGADLALVGAARNYSTDQLIVLRYHQHAVGPDPMTNSDSESRAVNYGVEETPAVFLNGIRVFEFKGYLEHVKNLYQGICTTIDDRLGQSTPVTIDAKVKQRGRELDISVAVAGLKEISSSHRLCVALAEDKIFLRGANGVMNHEMVVRKIIGGPEGIPPKDGRLAYEGTLSLDKLKDELRNYLNQFEAGEGFAFPTKPMELKKFHLVVFVQDTAINKEKRKNIVLQATAIPIAVEDPATDTAKPAGNGSQTPAAK